MAFPELYQVVYPGNSLSTVSVTGICYRRPLQTFVTDDCSRHLPRTPVTVDQSWPSRLELSYNVGFLPVWRESRCSRVFDAFVASIPRPANFTAVLNHPDVVE